MLHTYVAMIIMILTYVNHASYWKFTSKNNTTNAYKLYSVYVCRSEMNNASYSYVPHHDSLISYPFINTRPHDQLHLGLM